MDTPLINQMRNLAFYIKSEFGTYLNQYDNEKHVHEFEGWSDWFWSSDKIRKAHLKIIEPTEKTKSFGLCTSTFSQKLILMFLFLVLI
jgi:hypothetical protein